MIRTVRDVRWMVGKHLWPLRLNRIRYLGRRITHRWQLVARAESPITGVITVWDLGRERRMLFGEDPSAVTQSAIFTSGEWSELWREYWGHALGRPVELPERPRVLVLGLGGGTIVRMVYQRSRPSLVTVVELDPVVVATAREYMGLGSLPDLEIRVGDARDVLAELSSDEPYDLVIEDVFYNGLPERGASQLETYVDSLAVVVTQQGWLVLNRWFGDWSGAVVDSGQAALAAALAERFARVERRQITQRWLNELIFATGRRSPDQQHGALHGQVGTSEQ